MTPSDLRTLLNSFEAHDELLRVRREVDPRFELPAVVRRVQKDTNRAVIFERVKGSSMPVVSNLWGTHRRAGLGLGIASDALARTWAQLESDLASWPDGCGPTVAGDYEEISLRDLPVVTHCAGDAGPYITGGVAQIRDPQTGVYNLSYHRIQVIDDQELRLRNTPGHHLGAYHDLAEAAGRNSPTLILIGAPPSVMWAAASRLPLRCDEYRLAAAFEGRPLPMHDCQASDLRFPAGTEVVIEGELLCGERRPEGPFGDFMDNYIAVDNNHVFVVKGVYRRRDAVYHDIFSGSAEELLLLSIPVAANVYRAVNRVVPSVIDVACWPFVYNCVVKMTEEFDGQAKQALMAAFGAEPTWVRQCTVVDADVDIFDPADVTWAISTRSRLDQDVVIVPGVPSFRRDVEQIHRGRLGIDATVPFAFAERFRRRTVPGEADLNLADYI